MPDEFNLPKTEEKILKFWEQNSISEKNKYMGAVTHHSAHSWWAEIKKGLMELESRRPV